MRIGIVGVDSSHAEDFLRHFNAERRHNELRVAAIWGGDSARMAELCAASPEVRAADSLADLIGSVDAVIVGDRHGALHRGHALAAIEARRPIFVDKPLANSLIDAVAIVEAAERAGVPLLSGSALRWQAETLRVKAKILGLDGPIRLTAYGTWYPQNAYGGAIFYAIHTIELAQELLGAAWQSLRLKSADGSSVQYRAGPHEVTLEFRPLEGETSDFGVKVRAQSVKFEQKIPLGDDYMLPVVDRIAAMLRTGHGGLTREELLAPVRMMEAIAAVMPPS
ncbi:MAG TPA: Gfo/Idh/MocA family oxidoreductase [Devosia sp.]|nr:Gfo/Idh/MocA family oxidoreductase [Devosia sp.]